MTVVKTSTQLDIFEWFDAAIKENTTPGGSFRKFSGEYKELADAMHELRDGESLGPHEREEAADVLISFICWARYCGIDLNHEVQKKMKVNRDRTWGPPDADGVIQHVEEADA